MVETIPSFRIKDAIDATQELVVENGLSRWEYLVTIQALNDETRKTGRPIYNMTPGALQTRLSVSSWSAYEHPALKSGCAAFQSAVPGRMSIITTQDLPPDQPILLRKRKKTGKIYGVAEHMLEEYATFSVIILGPYKEREVVYDLHPGQPRFLSEIVEPYEDIEGEVVGAQEAFHLGLKYVKT